VTETTRFFDVSAGELREFERVAATHLSGDDVRRLNKEPELWVKMVDALHNQSEKVEQDIFKDLFLHPSQQWKLFLEYNQGLDQGWKFEETHYVDIGNPPELPEGAGPLCVVQLVPYQETVEKTIAFLLGFVQSQMEKLGLNYYQWEGYNDLLTKKDVIRLLPGIEHPRKCLRWEIIDLGANRNRKPCDVRNESSPHAAVLAAAGFHTNWSTSMDGDKIPYVFMPGYQVTVPSGDSWQCVPHIWFDQHDRRLKISYNWDGSCSQSWAVVVFAL